VGLGWSSVRATARTLLQKYNKIINGIYLFSIFFIVIPCNTPGYINY